MRYDGDLMSSATELLSIFGAEQGQLKRMVRRITGNAHTAEDVVHETFIKLMNRKVTERDVGLVVTTARNLACDTIRAERVRASYASNVSSEQLQTGVVDPEDAVASRLDLDALLRALQTLPVRTQRIFLLSKVDGMTYPQIARSLNISVSTVEKEMISALEFCRTWRQRRETI
ncbi:RNA polymerase sigma factor [Rhodopseudomonas palustris]|uniref:RNA polymerase sigma-70 factor n=3 Tax=Rhodopseudomonas TaxID=1073 RepID=A0A336JNV4_9BRAD|nr:MULTISPECIES: RNA polymerase sigma factor [Rhodopseudomonas]MCD0421841.1 RNA polymerase sigma factor [Rubrivivax sp. JA1024]NEW92898.1 sigma-70 family RNA polymerase sigma factor [Rhodopseudomonas sp. BR0M22]RED33194.1 RNA polymerase sigma-70 factor (ECF subfamily) [Rhodopseudomonas pentothenatexigens]REF93943.1 RNA polymerase sigma-70 factor (ECF subfamily) [Rhodopseudomonas thermotolerans]UYO46815.1 RNA polymerase sigma factor [Rhodopseudomonas palustris]